ncbi:unnamed protein product [Moneuplotes crassus]|uniref:Uncharacterized protein n=2 Tax=Euplotes crassus TaxID=5936 RepID=A0AAD2CZ62_EUPCR|nr:unnamed protein product [Moneuplotes crassus]
MGFGRKSQNRGFVTRMNKVDVRSQERVQSSYQYYTEEDLVRQKNEHQQEIEQIEKKWQKRLDAVLKSQRDSYEEFRGVRDVDSSFQSSFVERQADSSPQLHENRLHKIEGVEMRRQYETQKETHLKQIQERDRIILKLQNENTRLSETLESKNEELRKKDDRIKIYITKLSQYENQENMKILNLNKIDHSVCKNPPQELSNQEYMSSCRSNIHPWKCHEQVLTTFSSEGKSEIENTKPVHNSKNELILLNQLLTQINSAKIKRNKNRHKTKSKSSIKKGRNTVYDGIQKFNGSFESHKHYSSQQPYGMDYTE